MGEKRNRPADYWTAREQQRDRDLLDIEMQEAMASSGPCPDCGQGDQGHHDYCCIPGCKCTIFSKPAPGPGKEGE